MAYGFSITESLQEHITDEKFLDSFRAWENWARDPGGIPVIGGYELEDIQWTRDQQMRLIKDTRGDWLCTDFAPGLVDFAGFSLAGQLLRSVGEAFAKIHIDNPELALKKRRPVYTIFKAIKATHVELWMGLYLPVRFDEEEPIEVIAILQPLTLRQQYLEGLLNSVDCGLMTVSVHPVDGDEKHQLQIIEGNRPLGAVFERRVYDISGMDPKDLWADADHQELYDTILDVWQDGQARHFEAILEVPKGTKFLKAKISRAPWGVTFHVWEKEALSLRQVV